MLLCFKVCYLWSQLCLTAANNAVVKTEIYFNGFKRSWLLLVIGGFRSVLCVSVFQGSLLVFVIIIDGSE